MNKNRQERELKIELPESHIKRLEQLAAFNGIDTDTVIQIAVSQLINGKLAVEVDERHIARYNLTPGPVCKKLRV